ncbi:MAG: glycoside hydrolase family 88 protein [Cyclobacteriaceae bacterium]|nr:glycoside hydrolase family 88 protein [Cyclobacteriaceae bacterium]
MAVILLHAGCRNTRDVVFEHAGPAGPPRVDSLLNHFAVKYAEFLGSFTDTVQFPRSFDQDRIVFTTSSGWTSGFFPGILWNLYRYNGDALFLNAARSWTHSLLTESDNVSTHDVGFIINSSVGLGYIATDDKIFRESLLRAAESLASRYHDQPGCIKSLDDFNGYAYPVLIDNLVNLEILFRAWKISGNEAYYQIAYAHALKTMENHLRKDFSVYQLVDYDTESGAVVFRGTFQGYDTASNWSRGQAWGIYGFSMAFRETRDRIFLDQAERMAEFLLKNPYFMDGYVPFWDMTAPKVPHELRDASSAAILASAFMELSTFPEVEDQAKYFKTGENILKALSKPQYCSGVNENEFFVVKHCVGNYPGNSEVDVPLIYADYYFLEALLKYRGILNHQENE